MSFLKSKPIEQKQSGTSSSTTTTDLPDYVTDASKTAIGIGSDLALNPWKAYEGPRVADFSTDTQTAFSGIRDLFNKAMSSTTGDTAVQGALDYAKAPAQKIGFEGTFDSGDIAKYMNQYSDAALQPALRKIQEASDAARKRISAGATSAGSFGDARHGILEAKNQSDTAQAIGDTASQFFSSAFDKAVAAKQGDLTRKTATDTTNANFFEQALSRLLGGTGAAVTQQGASQGNILQAIQALLGGGQTQTAQDQAKLDAAKAQYEETNNNQLTALNALLASLKAPYEGTTTSSGTQTGTSTQTGGPSPWASILGAALGTAATKI